MSYGLFKMLPTNYSFTNHIYLTCVCVCVYKLDLALNNLQGLICHKIQPINLKKMVSSDKNYV